jgi:hypothetical protein
LLGGSTLCGTKLGDRKLGGEKLGGEKLGGTKSSDSFELDQNYFTGVNYLLNEPPDKAIDALVRSLEVNADTVKPIYRWVIYCVNVAKWSELSEYLRTCCPAPD